MSLKELIAEACEQPTLLKALSWIAVWENDRAVKQALRGEIGPNGQTWDTTFEFLFKEVMDAYPKT